MPRPFLISMRTSKNDVITVWAPILDSRSIPWAKSQRRSAVMRYPSAMVPDADDILG